MNIQAIMKQAQQVQKEMLKKKEEIDNKLYVETNSFVTVEVHGTKKINKIKIEKNNIEEDDIEIIEDLITVALNSVFNKIDKETEEQLGKYTKGLPGLF